MDNLPTNSEYPSLNRLDLTEQTYRILREWILKRQIQPGEKVSVEAIAAGLGVSRTPIIKALHLLIGDNLVVYTPRKGFTVKELTTQEMAEIFYIRGLLDGAAAREAAEKATEEELAELEGYFAGFLARKWDAESRARYMECDKAFHLRLYEIAAVPLLLRINETFNIMRVSYQRGLLRDPDETLVEHLSIIEAIKNRDPELAERLARAHTSRSRAVLLRRLKEGE